MDIKSIMAKSKLLYRKGLIEARIEDDDLYASFFYSKFWTQHPSNPRRFYCILNNTALDYLRPRMAKIQETFDVAEEFLHVMDSYGEKINYAGKKEKVYEMANIEGIELYDYQKYSLQLMLERERHWALLGQGTGKTMLCIAYVKSNMAYEHGTYVIVTPKRVLKQYKAEIEKYLPEVDVQLLIAGRKFRYEHDPTRTQIILTNYAQIPNLPTQVYHSVLFDEAQNLNGFSSDVNQAASKLVGMSWYEYFLTGTPEDDSRDEIFNQFKVSLPYLVPFKTLFMNRYFFMDDHQNAVGEKRREELTEIIDALTWGDLSEVLLGDELPPEVHYIIECKFKSKRIYNLLDRDDMLLIRKTDQYIIDPNDVLDWEENMDDYYLVDVPNDASKRSKKRQLCNGFIYATDPITNQRVTIWMDDKPKWAPFINLLLDVDHGLVFTQFLPDVEIVSDILTLMNKSYHAITKATTEKQTDERIQDFKDGLVDFLVIHNKSGGTGLHTVNTNNIISYALPDSFLTFDQGRFRTRRKGQTAEVCNYYSFITKGSVEKERVLPKIKYKAAKHKSEFKIYRRKSNGS